MGLSVRREREWRSSAISSTVFRESSSPMWLDAAFVADVRGNTSASIVWQEFRAEGQPSPTWSFSDAAREARAQAMLYSSRPHPGLSHVVVFQPYRLRFAGPISDLHG